MKKGNKIFDYLNAINNKTPLEYDKKVASAYMLALWLSHDKDLIFIVNEVNEILFKLPDEGIYKCFYSKIPKKQRYIKWIKKEKLDKKSDKMVKELVEKYNLSEEEAKRCLLN